MANPAGFSSAGGAIEFWMKPDGSQASTLFHFYEVTTTDYIRCYLNTSTGRFDLIIEDENEMKVNVYYDLDNLEGGYLGEWIHVMWVQDCSGVKLYLNGEEKTLSGTNSGDWCTDHLSLYYAKIGYGTWGYFKGNIDEFRLYNTAPDVDEAYACYAEIFKVGSIAFDDGSVAIIIFQESAETLSGSDFTIQLTDLIRWKRDGVIKSLMIPLFVVMGSIFAKDVLQCLSAE